MWASAIATRSDLADLEDQYFRAHFRYALSFKSFDMYQFLIEKGGPSTYVGLVSLDLEGC